MRDELGENGEHTQYKIDQYVYDLAEKYICQTPKLLLMWF